MKIDWGGIAGIVSLAVLMYDKLSSKPKLVLSIKESTLRLSPSENSFFLAGSVSVLVGNIGNEPTAITDTSIFTDSGEEIHPYQVQDLSERVRMSVQDHRVPICGKGEADVHTFAFRKNINTKISSLTLVMKDLKGKEWKMPVPFIEKELFKAKVPQRKE